MNKVEIRDFFRARFGADLSEQLASTGHIVHLEKDEYLFSPGDILKEVPFVLSGQLRVLRSDEDENELFLYYLGGGETCALSLHCCMQSKASQVTVAAEEKTEVLLIPSKNVNEWLKFPEWKSFVFESYNLRFEEMLRALDTLAFMKMDQRLMTFLLDVKQGTGNFEIHKTHQEIADALNTSRVVVSRLLKKLEIEGKIELFRNRIDIL